MNSTLKSLVFWMALVVVGVVVWNFSTTFQTSARPLSFSEFMASVDSGQIDRVTITGNEITGVNKANENFRTYAPPQYEGLANRLIERNVVVTMWNWADSVAFMHDEISTDRRSPSINAGGPVYGVDIGNDNLTIVDPTANTARMVKIPTRDEGDWNFWAQEGFQAYRDFGAGPVDEDGDQAARRASISRLRGTHSASASARRIDGSEIW